MFLLESIRKEFPFEFAMLCAVMYLHKAEGYEAELFIQEDVQGGKQMRWQDFNIIMTIWNILFFLLLILCMVISICSVKRRNKKFFISYIVEAATVVINLTFMYVINERYIDYGEDKFSGLNALGDWLGFGILIIITLIPLVTTIVCNIIYAMKIKKKPE